MIRYNAFWRKFITRKLADLSRLLPIEELTELPVGAMGHILDNFNLTQPISLVPRKNSVIWKLKPEKKILYNYTQPIKDPVPVPISMKGITLPQAGLSREILKFKSENMQLVKTVLDPSQLPARPNVQCLISYNSLFRMRIPGVLRIYRMMNFIFSNIIDQVCQFPDRVHFIHIPFSDVEEINSTTAVESLMNDIEYILNFLEEENNNYNVQNGIYGWEDEYYLFSHNKLEYSNEVYSRSDFLRSFKEHTKATIRYPQTPQYLFLMHLFGFVESNSRVSLFEYIPDDMLDKINFLLTTDKFALIYNLAELRRLNGDSNTILLRLIANVNDLIRSNYEDPKEYTNVSINDESSEEADNQLAIQSTKKTNKPIPDTPIELLSYEPVEDDVIGDDSLIRLNDIKVGTPNATNTPAINITLLEYEIIETYNLENTQSFVDKMASSIQSDTTLSNAQRTRAAKMAFAYKELTYDNVPVSELLDIPTDESLDDSKLDFFDNNTEVPDKSMLDSSISVFNSSYMKKTFNHDMVSTLVSFNEQGMFLTDIKTEDKSDELNRLIQYRVTYEDKKHKKHTIKFTIPKFDEDGTCYVNGTVKIIKPQRISNPITKIGPDTVRLNSNYNRYLIQRNTAVAHSIDQKITKLLRKHSDRVSITSKNNDYKELTVPYDYSAIGSKINTIVIDDGTYKFIFEYSNRFNDKFVDSIGLDYLKEIENNLNAVYIGYRSKTKIEYYFLKLDGSLVSIDKQEKNIAYTGTLLDKICEILGERPTPLTEYITFETTSKILPIIIPLAYRFGLSNILTYLNATYDIVDINERISTTPSDIVIKFKDKKLIFKRYPTLVSLIVAGLSEYDLRNINLEEMDSPDIYFSLIQSKGLSPHVIKSIDNYFDLFLDPMTKDVLLRMGEPTNTKDLLIRGVQLLVTTDHKAVASATNYRFRSYERIPAIIYNTLATNFANYRAKAAGTKDTFSISEFEVYQNILKDPLLETVDVINPINDIKYMCEYSHVGMSGRTQESFVVNDRRYEKDAIGTMSEAAVDNSKVGMNAQMPMNPSIINTRGMTAHVPSEDIKPSQLLSVTGLVMPGLTNDDVKRANFANIQASAVMPTKKSEVSRIRTGYEEIIAHRTHMPFAYVAKHDGVIVDIDTDLKMIKLQYKDNSTYSVHYGEEYTSNSGSGFYTTQKIVVNNWKIGDRFKKGDVICYNPEFFTPDPFSKQVAWNIGVLANVAFLECDGTLEDSSVVSKRLGDDLEIAPVHVRTITISKKSTIHKYIPVGVECSSLDNLIVFDESALEENLLNTEDDELANMLADLNHSTPKAKYDGVVVKIETFFRCDLNEMSPSLQKLVKVCNKDKNAKAEFASDSKNNYKYQKLNKITQSDRLGNIDLTDDVVVLKFYIQQHHGMHAGDKIVYDSSLKSVCARVLEEPILSEDKSVEVDALMSYRSINARLIMSPILVGAATRVMEKLESDILDMYFDDKSGNGSNEHLDHTLSLENSSSVNDIDIIQESLETKMLDQMSGVYVSTEGWLDPVKEDGMYYTIRNFPTYQFFNKLRKEYKTTKLSHLFEVIGIKLFSKNKRTIVIHKFFVPELLFLLNKYNFPNSLINTIRSNTWVGAQLSTGAAADLLHIKNTMTVELYPHQKEFIENYVFNKTVNHLVGCLLSFEQGLGKTITSLALMQGLKKEHVVIVCPKNTMLETWNAHLEKFFNTKQKVYIVGHTKDVLSLDYRWIIVNYEQIGKISEFLVFNKLSNLGIIVDESHNFLRTSSQRTQLLIDLAKFNQNADILLMSGTPIKSCGNEMIPVLQVLDPYFDEDAVNIFKKTFGANTVIANDVLNARLNRMMVRVRKNILNLPEKKEITISVKMPTGQKYTASKIEKEITAFIKQREDYYNQNLHSYIDAFEEAINWLRKHPVIGNSSDFERYLSIINYLKKANINDARGNDDIVWMNRYEKDVLIPALPVNLKKQFIWSKSVVKYLPLKIKGEVIGQLLTHLRMQMTSEMMQAADLKQYVDKAMKKVVIFSSYVDTIELAYNYFRDNGYNPIAIYGKTASELTSLIEKFQNDQSLNPLIASLKMLSTGATLTAASTAIFLNKPWRSIEYQQASDRIHRIGQDTPCEIISLVLDTGNEANLSTRMEDIMRWSEDQFDQIVDKKEREEIKKFFKGFESLDIPADCFPSTEKHDLSSEPETLSKIITANTPNERRGPISEEDKKKIGKYIYHGTHRDLDIKNLGIHVCKNRANTDIKAPVVYMNRSIGVASLHVVPFMIGHESKLKNYEEHFVNLEEAIRSESPVQHVEIIHNDPNLEECSGEQIGYIYWVEAKEFLDDLYYATPDKPNDWNFVSYRQLPIAKKTKVKVTWHKRYDEKFAKK